MDGGSCSRGEGKGEKRLVGKCKMFIYGVLLHYCDLTAGLVLNNSTIQANSTSGIYYIAFNAAGGNASLLLGPSGPQAQDTILHKKVGAIWKAFEAYSSELG